MSVSPLNRIYQTQLASAAWRAAPTLIIERKRCATCYVYLQLVTGESNDFHGVSDCFLNVGRIEEEPANGTVTPPSTQPSSTGITSTNTAHCSLLNATRGDLTKTFKIR